MWESFTRSIGLEKHRRTSTDAPAVVLPTVAKKRCTGHDIAPERLQFKLLKTREALEGNVQQFTVNI